MNRNILITGGAGFIGSHLADYHIQKGDRVHIMDDLSTGSFKNVEHLKEHEHFGYTLESITNRQVAAELVDNADFVYHLAAAVGVKLIVESPVRTIEANIGGTQIILDLCVKKKKKLLVASTSEVYGKSKDIPFKEDGDIVIGPTSIGRWAYASSKAIDEFLSIAYFREKGCPVVVARFFNTVGPRQSSTYGMVVPRFVEAALSGKDLLVYGDGNQSRCFTHVKDVVLAVSKLMENDKAYGQVFNVGSNEEVTIAELAEKIIKLSHSSSRIRKISYEEVYGKGFEDMDRRVPSQEKLKAHIGVYPQTPLEEILKDVIAYHTLHRLSTNA